VVHVEDEPPKLYARITEAGIAPDTVLRIEQKDSHEIEIRTEGRTFIFPNEVAAQITAVGLATGETFDDSVERLSGLHPGESAAIAGLSSLCRGLERNRLLDLGIVPGTTVTIELVNPSGSPIAYRIRGACIALRQDQAERIRIRKVRQ
jgi:DtxR family Mn-dependent transcriptional regulator